MELEYFCKTHNQLCCAACLCKIKKNENGKHLDCDTCTIEEIKNVKMNKMKENLKYLEELSNSLQQSIIQLKILFEKINENKEELKSKIQKIFTRIRNELNNREEELLLEIDKKFEDIYCNKSIIKESEKLPSKIKNSLEKGKMLDIKYYTNKLSLFIYDCINIENNINNINIIDENIKKCDNLINIRINFIPYEEEKINDFIKSIKSFGIVQRLFQFSSIINRNIEKETAIINWIEEKTNKNIISFELIFKMSENGSNCKDFHKYCDNKGPTLTLIKTKNNRIFGGFTPLNWNNSRGVIIDQYNQTFVFSLNLMKKFDMINSKKDAIHNQENNGPFFGNNDFSLYKNMKKGIHVSNEYCNFFSKNNNLELSDGSSSTDFETDELEIFKVIY